MKKLSFVLAVIMLTCALPLSVFAADTTVSVSSATAKPGDEIVLTLDIKNSPGIAGAEFYIEYNSDAMTYVSGKGISKDFYCAVSPNADSNPVKVVVANLGLNNITGDIAVAELTFRVKAAAEAGSYALTLATVSAFCSEGEENNIVSVPLSVKNGTLTVSGGTTPTNPSTPSVNPGTTPNPSTNKFEKTRTYSGSFADVASSAWYNEYVKLAYEYGLANGVSDTSFAPDATFKVSEALTAAVNIHKAYHGKTVRAKADGEAWYDPYIEYCVENGIIKENQFTNLNVEISRGDMAVVFANVLPDSEYKAVRSGAPVDVDEENYVYASVKKLFEAGIVSGDKGTQEYRPNDKLARKEAVVIFTRFAATEKRDK